MEEVNLTPEEKERIKKMREEMEKYLSENKRKKAYGLYLTEEDVNVIKDHIKVPLSKVIDDMVRLMSKSLQEREKAKKEKQVVKEEKKNDEKKE